MVEKTGRAAQLRMLGGRTFSCRDNGVRGASSDAPLIVAIHGGGYSSAYFDIEGFSLLARAAALDIPAVALDRAGYGSTDMLDEADLSHQGQADLLMDAIGDLWSGGEFGGRGVVLIGHSIGGAIALDMAGRQAGWPLLGVAVSGVGLRNAPGDEEAWSALPPVRFIEFPPALKDAKMFGAPATFIESAPQRSRLSDAPASRRELIDIVTSWPEKAEAVLARIAVPVHYRQAESDALWTVNEAEVARFGDCCSKAAWADVSIVKHAGHCIDFHRIGASFQLEQLAFALKCGIYAWDRAE